MQRENCLHPNLINGLTGKILSYVVMHPTSQELPYSVQLPPQVLQPFSASEIKEAFGWQAGRVLRLPSLLTYPVNFHCYPFIVIKFMGEKDGIILRHN
jgi:hypothetical protein